MDSKTKNLSFGRRASSGHIRFLPSALAGFGGLAASCLLPSCALAQTQNQSPLAVEMSGYKKAAGILVKSSRGHIRVEWPTAQGVTGSLLLNLEAGQPLIESLAITPKGRGTQVLGRGLNPFTLLTVGTRDMKNPAGWVAFFDNPPRRPYQTYPVTLIKRSAQVSTQGAHTTVSIGEVSAGSFRGDLRFTFYRNSPLLHVETVVKTQEDGRAILYDTGLTSGRPNWKSLVYRDTDGNVQSAPVNSGDAAFPMAVAGRTLIAENQAGQGSLAVFPAPHQFFFPLDEAFNLKFVWYGKSYGATEADYGFGIRQTPEGDRRYVPWFNAPPGTEQHLGVFYLLSAEKGAQALDEVARYTNGDRYPKLDGYKTYTSHYHIEHTLEYRRRQREQQTTGVPQPLEVPGFVKTFKARGINIAHLAEFHIGDTPNMKDEERLPLLKLLHQECARLSDAELLVLPGEEPNVHLGGHWLSFFPKPVYWVLNRPQEKPFVENVEGYGKVYHVGSTADVLRLMETEGGLMWTAHPRIKASMGFPDRYKDSDFFRSDRFLGGAWKAMPADLSWPRLGPRVLDLMDDMANWGMKKYTPGEADLFRMETNFETYAHLNVNYLKLNTIPRFGDGWPSVLEALRGGRYFTTTGEVLIPDFTVGGKSSGDTLDISRDTTQNLQANLSWRFPMAFAEIVSGDGQKVYRQRIDLSDSEQFGSRKLNIPLDLKGRTWVRIEAWDIAANGAFTPPIWLSKNG